VAGKLSEKEATPRAARAVPEAGLC
jgi:hypothetical protein